jgi:hypothetical protein
MDWQSELRSIDASHPDAAQHFQALLKEVPTRTGLSYAEINRRSIENARQHKSDSISTGSISAIRKQELSTRRTVEALLTAVRLPKDVVDEWLKLRDDIALRCPDSSLLPAAPLHPRIQQLETEVQTVRQHAAELGVQKEEVEQKLATEIESGRLLTAEIDRLRADLNQADQHAGDLERELQAMLSAKVRENARIDTNVEVLRAELRILAREQENSARAYQELQDAVNRLNEVSASHEEALDLHVRRVQHERELREQAEQGVRSYESRLRQVEQLLGDYQAQATAQSSLNRDATEVVPTRNDDVDVALPVAAEDFGTVQLVGIVCQWYCRKCTLGGRCDYDACPHCQGAVVRNFYLSLPVSLPDKLGYGVVIRLKRHGYADVPGLPAGDAVVSVIS